MKKKTLILKYLLGFILSFLVSCFVLLLVLKFTIYNKNYIYHVIDRNKYYDLVYDEINMEMKNTIMSTGFTEEILKDLFTKEEVKSDLNLFIDNSLKGKKTTLKKNNIKEKLDENINEFLKKSNLKILNDNNLKEFEQEIEDIYTNEITLYKMANSYILKYHAFNKYLTIGLVLLLILISVIAFYLIRKIGVILVSSGLIILFLRMSVYERIDMDNILVITENFSILLRSVLNFISKMLLYSSLVMIIGGIWFIVSSSLERSKKLLK